MLTDLQRLNAESWSGQGMWFLHNFHNLAPSLLLLPVITHSHVLRIAPRSRPVVLKFIEC